MLTQHQALQHVNQHVLSTDNQPRAATTQNPLPHQPSLSSLLEHAILAMCPLPRSTACKPPNPGPSILLSSCAICPQLMLLLLLPPHMSILQNLTASHLLPLSGDGVSQLAPNIGKEFSLTHTQQHIVQHHKQERRQSGKCAR